MHSNSMYKFLIFLRPRGIFGYVYHAFLPVNTSAVRRSASILRPDLLILSRDATSFNVPLTSLVVNLKRSLVITNVTS